MLATGLIKPKRRTAILFPGTREHAIIAEEYSLLGALGLQVAKQSLLQTKRGPVDALDVVNPTNNERSTVYFNVSRVFAAMSRLGGVQNVPPQLTPASSRTAAAMQRRPVPRP